VKLPLRPLRATVLVLDDEDMSRELIARILREHGCEVLTASTSTDAYVKLASNDVDLMLCDVVMPHESGPEFLARLRSEMPNLPVVMVSGIANAAIAQVALELGAYGYVTKPFSAGQLIIAVTNAVQRHALERENRRYRERAEKTRDTREQELHDLLDAQTGVATELRHSTDALVALLARTIAGRGVESGDHVVRVGRYARVISEAVDLTKAQCDQIEAGSVLHDIGKIGLPAQLLVATEALTFDERELVKRHTDIGYRILTSVEEPSLEIAASIALTHHERWDGSGYPRGLRGGTIPIEGRVVAVANVFDSLVSDSGRHAGLELDDALAVMHVGRGTEFDADVLDAFFDRPGDIARILEQARSGECASVRG
jgi:putative two-component system response regulator